MFFWLHFSCLPFPSFFQLVRLELEEREAALPKRQSKDLKLRLCKYMDWLTLCDSKKAERTGVLGELGFFKGLGVIFVCLKMRTFFKRDGSCKKW